MKKIYVIDKETKEIIVILDATFRPDNKSVFYKNVIVTEMTEEEAVLKEIGGKTFLDNKITFPEL